ncbi:glutamine amidotransferase [Nocardioides limicola]|uniref:glutamine amidotransferase n=1 Tax=Nocardioides limicola TaxID=2803368 RepID=UPI00193B8432|nr:glutamine amidotransferase [Nocardioides sp. DJM-14]
MLPFVLLATRAEDAAAEDEYAAMLRFSGLSPADLIRVRLEREPLPMLDLDACSGVILGGSPYNASDPATAKSAAQMRVEKDLAVLLDEVVARDIPFLGCCYGIGALGTHQGAVVDRQYGEPVGPVTVRLSEAGRGDPLTGVLPDEFTAFVGHKEAISSLPAHAVNLAASPSCPVQAFRVGRNVYATQFHPELDAQGLATRVEAYKHYGYFAPEEAERLKEVARSAEVVHPPELLRRFVQLYARN